MKTWQSFSLGSVTTILLLGIIKLIASPPSGHPIELKPPGTPVPIVVHVSGAVENPDVYTLPYKSRIINAVLAAGGFSNDADTDALNLAKMIQDGDRIYVPVIASDQEENDRQSEQSISPLELENRNTEHLLNINEACIEELVKLPGIGEHKAESIVKYREENGNFISIEEIMEVEGIGQTIYNQIIDDITVK